LKHTRYDAAVLIDEQLQRMKAHLIEAGRWPQVNALADRLRHVVENPALDHGICHMDLTLDNVHRDGDTMTVFDFKQCGRMLAFTRTAWGVEIVKRIFRGLAGGLPYGALF